MAGPAAQTVAAFKAAVGRGDIAAARGLLHDDLSFHGPFDTFSSADDYLKALGKLAPIVKGIEPKATIDSGEDVAVFYEMTSSAGVAPIAEWHRVSDGKIASIRAYFDARPFAALFGSAPASA
jgi:ketosteroid isomerase-like protein